MMVATAPLHKKRVEELTPDEAQAEITRLQSETADLKGQIALSVEDGHGREERLHQLRSHLARLGISSPLSRVGMGPKPGDDGVTTVGATAPVVMLKA